MAVAEQIAPTVAPTKQNKVSQSYWSLVWWKFKRNRVAVLGGILLISIRCICGIQGLRLKKPWMLLINW